MLNMHIYLRQAFDFKQFLLFYKSLTHFQVSIASCSSIYNLQHYHFILEILLNQIFYLQAIYFSIQILFLIFFCKHLLHLKFYFLEKLILYIDLNCLEIMIIEFLTPKLFSNYFFQKLY